MLVRLQRPDHGLRVGVDGATPNCGTPAPTPRQDRLAASAPRAVPRRRNVPIAGQPQLQRLTQFVETQQHSAFVLETNGLFLEPFEKHPCRAAWKLIPLDSVEHGLLEFLAAYSYFFALVSRKPRNLRSAANFSTTPRLAVPPEPLLPCEAVGHGGGSAMVSTLRSLLDVPSESTEYPHRT